MSALLLVTGFYFIKFKKDVNAHRFCMLSAFGVSILFLISYLTYHYFHGATRFLGQGIFRPVYFSILISHTFLAVVIVPLILITLSFAIRGNFEKHKKIARITFPLWLYVSVTGVLIYFLLYHWFPHA
jgi:putative membrane protein